MTSTYSWHKFDRSQPVKCLTITRFRRTGLDGGDAYLGPRDWALPSPKMRLNKTPSHRVRRADPNILPNLTRYDVGINHRVLYLAAWTMFE